MGISVIIMVIHMPKISPTVHLKRLSNLLSMSFLRFEISALRLDISVEVSFLRPEISVSMWFSLLSICSRMPSIFATLSSRLALGVVFTV